MSYCYGQDYQQTAYDYCAASLEYYNMTYGAECGAAFEAYLACLSALTCEQLAAPDACSTEQTALDMTCTTP